MTSDAITQISAHLRTVRGLDHPIVFVKAGKVFAKSEDVATYFGKQHFNVLKAIRTLISHDNRCAFHFEFTSRSVKMPSGGKREVATCNMTRDGFTLLAMGFTGKFALQWKMRYIEAFNSMEQELAQPKPKQRQPYYKPMQLVDRMDAGMDMIATCEAALDTNGGVDRELILSIRSTIESAIKMLGPVRAHLNGDI